MSFSAYLEYNLSIPLYGFLSLFIIACFINTTSAIVPSAFRAQRSISPHCINIRNVNELRDAFSVESNIFFFTVGEAMKAQCPFCHLFKKEYDLLADQYYNKIVRTKINTAKHQDTAFFSVEYRVEMLEFFKRLNLQQIPSLIYFNDSKILTCNVLQNRMQDCINNWLNVALNVPSQLESLNAHRQSGHPGLESATKSAEMVKISLVALFFISTAIFIFFAFKAGFLTMFLTYISWIVYGLSLGGTVFIWINHPPAFQLGPKGAVYFYNSQMQQLSLEGYIAGATMILNAACFLSLTQVVPKFESSWTRRMVSSFLVSTWIVTTILCVGFFVYKSSWYMSGTPFGPYLSILRHVLKGE